MIYNGISPLLQQFFCKYIPQNVRLFPALKNGKLGIGNSKLNLFGDTNSARGFGTQCAWCHVCSIGNVFNVMSVGSFSVAMGVCNSVVPSVFLLNRL